MKTYIYRELIANGFKSLGKNNVNHKDIIKAFATEGHYIEIYKEIWGYSVHLYGKCFMNGYDPSTIDIVEQKDVKQLRSFIKNNIAK